MQSIFIHGLGQNSSSWDKTVSLLEGSIEASRPDLPALLNGKEPTYSNLYRAFSDLCSRYPGPLHMCGLSLGGILALHFTIDFPERVKSLVLIGTPYHMPKTLLKVQNLIFRFMPESAFQQMGFQKKDFIRLAGSMADLDYSGQLKEISCPTLVLCGEKDNPNKKAAVQLSESIPRAKLKLIPNAGHEVNTDNPQQLAEALNSFYHQQRI